MRQSLAIFLDAYRELNSKKLFWIVLSLSVVVVAAFGMVGLNERGITVLWWSLPSGFTSRLFTPALFYKTLFSSLGVKFWLSWVSTILALVATAGIFPDLISSGSIELTLCKPIGRLRLFLTKYIAGLMFTGVQVTLFTAAVFLVFGLRAGLWLPGLLWTVPIMVGFYSFLFCICVCLGIVTRSTVAALLLTLLIWFVAIFLLHLTEQGLLLWRTRNEMQQERLAHLVEVYEAQTKEGAATPETIKESVAGIFRADPAKKAADTQKTLDEVRSEGRNIRVAHSISYGIKTVLPKTTETVDLLERVLVSKAEMHQMDRDDLNQPLDADDEPANRRVDMRVAARRVQEQLRARPLWWVLGTSFGFEALVLGVAAWIFCRRDF